MQQKVQLVVIGGGPAGIAAALEAAKFSDSIALVSGEKPGGRALWHSLIPSKLWLHAADTRLNDPRDILEKLELIKKWQYENYMEQLAHAGIEVIVGAARFKSRNVILIRLENGEEKELITDKVIIASGSVPIFPPGLKPDADRIIAPRLLGKMREIPASIIVIGGGVTGSEMIYLFNQLGTHVTAVTDVPTLLPRADADVSETLEMALRKRGVIFHKNKRAASAENLGDHVKVTLEDGTELVADMAFVAIGRRPDVDGLHLANIGLNTQSGIAVDAQCRTTIDGLFAAGDVTGAPMTANRAMAMARIAARNALSDHQQSYNENLTVEAVYTDPEVAQVGDTSGVNAEIYAADFETNLKANIANSKSGFIKLFVHERDHRIVGASAIGSHVSEIVFSVAVAIASDMTLADFQNVVPANPTLSEVFVDLKRVEKLWSGQWIDRTISNTYLKNL